jgi:ATP synthase protein I
VTGRDDGTPDGLARAARLRHERRRRAVEPSLGRYLAQIGVVGWMVVTPGLLGVVLGRWLDRTLGTGIFCTAPLLLAGLALGCWSAWKRMHTP